jgi:uncharacterized protein
MLQTIFLDDLGNIRSGWRVLLFLLLLFAAASIVFFIASVFTTDLAHYSPLLMVLCVFMATVIMVKLFEKRPIISVGIPLHPRMPLELVLGVVIGGLMMTVVFVWYFAMGWIELEWRGLEPSAFGMVLASTLVFYTLAGFGEELFFRGYPFQTLVESIRAPAAIIIMSAAFSAGHAMNPDITWIGFMNIFFAGVWLSVAYLRTRTLWLPAGLHISWNFFQGTVFSFPVSGIQQEGRSLFIGMVEGPAAITGGEFGPEGGLIVTVVLLAGTAYLYKSKILTIGEGVWTVERYIREELERMSK